MGFFSLPPSLPSPLSPSRSQLALSFSLSFLTMPGEARSRTVGEGGGRHEYPQGTDLIFIPVRGRTARTVSAKLLFAIIRHARAPDSSSLRSPAVSLAVCFLFNRVAAIREKNCVVALVVTGSVTFSLNQDRLVELES